MNLMESMQGVKGYSDSREEEEEEEAAVVATAATGEESSSARLHSPQSQQQQDAAWNSNPMINHRKQQQQLELMELTLGSSSRKQEEELGGNLQQASSSTSGKDDEAAAAAAAVLVVEKEHMFDKVVTPSDVGKLNRLVIPKQHAEKYFPLDSSSNEKGLLLNFEDRNGKLWRFRYSYWNSSQSYVMTKGWSRFVKEKKLDAGDIVSFHRGIGELYRHRLYIDWRPRSHHIPHPSNSLFHTLPYFLPNHHYSTATATARLYSLHSSTTNNYSNSTTIMPPPPPPYRDHHFHHHHHHLNYDNNNNFYTLHQHHQYPAEQLNSSLYYLTSPTPTTSPSMPVSAGDQHFPGPGQQLQERRNINNVPMIIDSVPVAHHHRAGTGTGTLITGATTPASNNNNNNNNNTTGKRLRLFGVNMECASSSASTAHVAMPNSHSLASSSLQRLSLPREDPLSSSSTPRFGDQKGGTSVLFDLDPSTQYQK